jgi:hypothetical protein
MADGKCREFMDEIKRLIIEEVDHTPNAKILLGAGKTFLATHLLDDSGDGIAELLNGKQLEQIQYKFTKLSPRNINNLVFVFKHHVRCGYFDNILELKFKSRYDYIQKCCFLGQVEGQKVFIFKMSTNVVGSGTSLVMRMQPRGDLQNTWIM